MLTTQTILARKINNQINIRRNIQTENYYSLKRIIPTSSDTVVAILDIYPKPSQQNQRRKWKLSSENRTVNTRNNSNSIQNYKSNCCSGEQYVQISGRKCHQQENK